VQARPFVVDDGVAVRRHACPDRLPRPGRESAAVPDDLRQRARLLVGVTLGLVEMAELGDNHEHEQHAEQRRRARRERADHRVHAGVR